VGQQSFERLLVGAAAGLVYGVSGYLKSRAASGEALSPSELFTAVAWGLLVGVVSDFMGVELDTAEKMLFDLGVLVVVKKLAETAWHTEPVKRMRSR